MRRAWQPSLALSHEESLAAQPGRGRAMALQKQARPGPSCPTGWMAIAAYSRMGALGPHVGFFLFVSFICL